MGKRGDYHVEGYGMEVNGTEAVWFYVVTASKEGIDSLSIHTKKGVTVCRKRNLHCVKSVSDVCAPFPHRAFPVTIFIHECKKGKEGKKKFVWYFDINGSEVDQKGKKKKTQTKVSY